MLRIDQLQASWERRAGIVIALIIVFAYLPSAEAADWYTGAAAPKQNDDWIVAVDASASVTTASKFAAISATIAPETPLNVTGTRIRVEGLAGTYTFDTPGSPQRSHGDQIEASILGGYEWVAANSSFAAYGGLNVRDSRFLDTDPGHAANGTQAGFKGVLEYYAKPSDRTMLSAYGSLSSNYDAYYARFRWGVSPVGQFYIGPEFVALGDNFYREWRLGAHLTAFHLGALQFGISGGYLLDKDGRSGGYGTLDVRTVY